MISLNQLRDKIHETAVKKGWWEEDRTFPEILALCHSELSEALEDYRDGKPVNQVEGIFIERQGKEPEFAKHEKPEGVPIELADCIIRILDYCGKEGIDIEAAVKMKMEFNETRPHRHGGKKI